MSRHKKKKHQANCCACKDTAPSQQCQCNCHDQEDAKYWEVMAFVWIFDAADEAARAVAWDRFCAAYPDHGGETAEEFWGRIQQTRWHHKHHHKYHKHHHPYDGGDYDGGDDAGGGDDNRGQ